MGRNVFVIAFVELSLPVFSDSDALFPWRERGTQGNARIGSHGLRDYTGSRRGKTR